MEKTYTEKKYVICYNDDGIVHYTVVSSGQAIGSGLPHYEEYDTEDEWRNRLESNFDIILPEDDSIPE
jgi:hypothetical protein